SSGDRLDRPIRAPSRRSTGVGATAAGRWLWRVRALTSPRRPPGGPRVGRSRRSPEGQKRNARAVATGRVGRCKARTRRGRPGLAPDLPAPVPRLAGARMALSSRSPEEQQLLARAVETGRVLWSKEHTALRCPCLADEHSVIAFYGEMSKDDQGFIHVEEWDLVGLEARTGQLLWRVAPPKFSSSLLTDGEYIVAFSEMGMRAWKLGAGKAKSA